MHTWSTYSYKSINPSMWTLKVGHKVHAAMYQPGSITIHMIDPELFFPHLMQNRKIVCPVCKGQAYKDGFEHGFRTLTSTFNVELLKVQRYRCVNCKSVDGKHISKSFSALNRYFISVVLLIMIYML